MFFYTKVTGVTYEGRQQIIRNLINQGLLQKGAELQLKRDIGNQYDSNAIAILSSNGQQIGYLPKECASKLSGEIKSGKKYKALVKDITGGNGYNYGINIKIEEIENSSTKFRFEIHTSGYPFVFNVFVTFYYNNYQSSVTTIPIDDSKLTSFQVNYDDKFDTVEVAFEEHLNIKSYKYHISEDMLGQEFGMKFYEVPDTYDKQTCAGDNCWFFHPNFEMEQVDCNSISVEKTPLKYNKLESKISDEDNSYSDNINKECVNSVV